MLPSHVSMDRLGIDWIPGCWDIASDPSGLEARARSHGTRPPPRFERGRSTTPWTRIHHVPPGAVGLVSPTEAAVGELQPTLLREEISRRDQDSEISRTNTGAVSNSALDTNVAPAPHPSRPAARRLQHLFTPLIQETGPRARVPADGWCGGCREGASPKRCRNRFGEQCSAGRECSARRLLTWPVEEVITKGDLVLCGFRQTGTRRSGLLGDAETGAAARGRPLPSSHSR